MKRSAFALAAAVLAGGAVYLALDTRKAPEAAPPQAEDKPVPPPPTPPESVTEAAKKFDAAQASLPTTEKIAALPAGQVHNTPKELVDAGFKIGEMAAAIAKDPSLEPQGLEFYGKCARREELPLSVRAHCLHNLRALAKKRGETADENGITDGVLKLEGHPR